MAAEAIFFAAFDVVALVAVAGPHQRLSMLLAAMAAGAWNVVARAVLYVGEFFIRKRYFRVWFNDVAEVCASPVRCGWLFFFFCFNKTLKPFRDRIEQFRKYIA